MSQIARHSAVATAAAILLGITGYLWFNDRGAGITFAQVIENVGKTQAVSCTLTATKGAPRAPVAKLHIQGERLRFEEGDYRGVDGRPKQFTVRRTTIIDVARKQKLELNHVDKTATKGEVEGRTLAEWNRMNFIEQLRTVKQDDAELIGEEDHDGRTVSVYRLTSFSLIGLQGKADAAEKAEMKIWVDPETGLPVRIRLAGVLRSHDRGYLEVEIDDFVWNEPVEAARFSLEVPEGYTLQEAAAGNAGPAR